MFLFLIFVCLVSAQDGIVEPNQDEIENPSKEAVVQHPVTVSIHAPEPMSTKAPNAPLKTRVVVVHNNMVPVPIECFQPPDSGTCSKDLARIYYDHETRTCKPFSYTGCGGNANRFQSIKNCYRICHPYRYKIRPKVANKDQQRGLKVRVIPAKQNLGELAQAQNQAAQARSLLGQPRPTFTNQQYGRPGGPGPQYGGPGGPGQAPYGAPNGSPYGRPYSRGQLTPLTERRLVMTPNGPMVKNQQIGQGGPHGQITNMGSLGQSQSQS